MRVDAKAFAAALAAVMPAASDRLGMVSSCIAINAEPELVRVTANNGEVQVSTVCAAEGDIKPVMVPAKRLAAVVRAIQGDVTLANGKGHHLLLTAGGSRVDLAGIDPREEQPAPPMEGELTPTGFDLVEAIRRLDYCAADYNYRAMLAGVLWESTGSSVRLAASDGRRCSVTDQPFEGSVARELLPTPVVQAIRAAFVGQPTVNVAISERFVRVEIDSTWLVGRLSGLTFPKIETVLPSHTTTAWIPREALVAAIKRVILVAGDEHKVTLNLAGDTLVVSATGKDVGEAEDTVTLPRMTDDALTTSVNGKYLLDALSAMDGDEVIMRYHDGLAPLDFESAGFRHVVMPMRNC